MYFGKYRGVVVDNIDPQLLGRITASVPDVLGQTPTSWAMPCLPWAGPQMGISCVPPIGASVWIEFEGGDGIMPSGPDVSMPSPPTRPPPPRGA